MSERVKVFVPTVPYFLLSGIWLLCRFPFDGRYCLALGACVASTIVAVLVNE